MTSKKKSIPQHIKLEHTCTSINDKTQERLRCNTCVRVIGWLATSKTCNKCSSYLGKFIRNDTPDTELKESDEDFKTFLETILPTANPIMKTLLKSQYDALQVKDSRQRRLDKDIIKVCLNLWSRSPQSYKDLQNSGVLILPSDRQLQKCKTLLNTILVSIKMCLDGWQMWLSNIISQHQYIMVVSYMTRHESNRI